LFTWAVAEASEVVVPTTIPASILTVGDAPFTATAAATANAVVLKTILTDNESLRVVR
jgi:hypothetical protein